MNRYTSPKSDARPSETRIVFGTLPVASSILCWHCCSVIAALGSLKQLSTSARVMRCATSPSPGLQKQPLRTEMRSRAAAASTS